MKQAINAYEQLKDAFDYTLRSWLRLDLTRKGRDESREIIGAARLASFSRHLLLLGG